MEGGRTRCRKLDERMEEWLWEKIVTVAGCFGCVGSVVLGTPVRMAPKIASDSLAAGKGEKGSDHQLKIQVLRIPNRDYYY